VQLYRLGPEGIYAVREEGDEELRFLYSDPFTVAPSAWELGRTAGSGERGLLPPVVPGKIVGVGRNFRAHAEELGNPVPDEPVLFLKSPGSVVGPLAPIVLPPVSEEVEYEGEIAVVLRYPLRQADREVAAAAVLGVTAAVDVTARDLQRRDPTFARAKSFDTFCPLGPAISVRPDLERLAVVTRVNGEERQRGGAEDMLWGVLDLLVYVSRMMSLDAGDVVLTGTPAGVGRLSAGDMVEVEVTGCGVLRNPVEAWAE
jgi:2-keto-4-pentenoate hydratase/2-oxohepta-3-ene-1,7-dioic acid hydratase in catechol pathway